jgi:hypothetical protein
MALDQLGEPKAASRWPSWVSGLDVFWLVLAVVLVVAVVFVASAARTSMNNVGTTVIHSERQPARPAARTSATIVVVQVSSHPTRAAAQAAAAKLGARGFTAKILDSDDYRPLNRGFFVVFVGPFPATDAGRDQAKRIQARLPGALVRDIHER